jgi:hypothetical protein
VPGPTADRVTLVVSWLSKGAPAATVKSGLAKKEAIGHTHTTTACAAVNRQPAAGVWAVRSGVRTVLLARSVAEDPPAETRSMATSAARRCDVCCVRGKGKGDAPQRQRCGRPRASRWRAGGAAPHGKRHTSLRHLARRRRAGAGFIMGEQA